MSSALGNFSINPGIIPASPFCKGGLRGIFLIQSGVIENILPGFVIPNLRIGGALVVM